LSAHRSLTLSGIPFRKRESFPNVARTSKELEDRLREKWADVLPPRL
jgi:hypothetical protein